MEQITEHQDRVCDNQQPEQKQVYRERPVQHRIVAWILIAIVLLAFLGTCYWLAFYGRV